MWWLVMAGAPCSLARGRANIKFHSHPLVLWLTERKERERAVASCPHFPAASCSSFEVITSLIGSYSLQQLSQGQGVPEGDPAVWDRARRKCYEKCGIISCKIVFVYEVCVCDICCH